MDTISVFWGYRYNVRIPRTEIGYEHKLAREPNDGHLDFFDRYYYREIERLRREQAMQDKR